jgi:hypothetical protein
LKTALAIAAGTPTVMSSAGKKVASSAGMLGRFQKRHSDPPDHATDRLTVREFGIDHPIHNRNILWAQGGEQRSPGQLPPCESACRAADSRQETPQN